MSPYGNLCVRAVAAKNKPSHLVAGLRSVERAMQQPRAHETQRHSINSTHIEERERRKKRNDYNH